MQKTAVGLFDNRNDAERAVEALFSSGFDRGDISVAAGGSAETRDMAQSTGTKAAEGAGVGAVTGTLVGGVAGVLVGAGLLAIPGIGPVLAVGPLAAAIGSGAAIAGAGVAGAGLGAASGGLIGALTGAGVPEDEAHVYAEGVRRGGALVVVHTDDDHWTTASEVLRTYGATDVEAKGAEYRVGGWHSFDPDGEPYDAPSSERADSDRLGSSAATSMSTGLAGSRVAAERTMVSPDHPAAPGVGSRPSLAGTEQVDRTRMGGAGVTNADRDAEGVEPVTGDDYARSSKAGTVAGGAAGAATGAAVGAAGGPVGAVVGRVAGAVVGGGLGAGADAAAKAEEDEARDQAAEDGLPLRDRSTNADSDERDRSRDTTGLAGRK